MRFEVFHVIDPSSVSFVPPETTIADVAHFDFDALVFVNDSKIVRESVFATITFHT